jgi:hypothetical protein
VVAAIEDLDNLTKACSSSLDMLESTLPGMKRAAADVNEQFAKQTAEDDLRQQQVVAQAKQARLAAEAANASRAIVQQDVGEGVIVQLSDKLMSLSSLTPRILVSVLDPSQLNSIDDEGAISQWSFAISHILKIVAARRIDNCGMVNWDLDGNNSSSDRSCIQLFAALAAFCEALAETSDIVTDFRCALSQRLELDQAPASDCGAIIMGEVTMPQPTELKMPANCNHFLVSKWSVLPSRSAQGDARAPPRNVIAIVCKTYSDCDAIWRLVKPAASNGDLHTASVGSVLRHKMGMQVILLCCAMLCCVLFH